MIRDTEEMEKVTSKHGKAITISLAIIIVSAIMGGVKAYIHVQECAKVESSLAVRHHEDKSIVIAHPETAEMKQDLKTIQVEQMKANTKLDAIINKLDTPTRRRTR